MAWGATTRVFYSRVERGRTPACRPTAARRRSRRQAERQVLERVVEVRPLAARLTGELDRREPVEELGEEHPSLEPGEVDTEAEVLGDPERQMGIRIPFDVEAVRVGE